MEVGMLSSSTSFSVVVPKCEIRSNSVAFLASKNSGDICRVPVLSPTLRSSTNGRAFYCGRSYKNSFDSREGPGEAVAFLPQAEESIKCFKSSRRQMLKLNNWVVRGYYKLVAVVNSSEQSIRALTDEQLRAKIGEFGHRLPNGAALDSIQAVVTINAYQAQRGVQLMGQHHRFLGLCVGLVQPSMRPHERLKAYACNVIYSNNLFWKTESAVFATRNVVRGISSWVGRRRRLRRIAATAERNEEGEVRTEEDETKENVTRATTLKQLDQQLTTLAEREDASASRPSLGPSVQQMRPVKREPWEQGKDGEVQWPDFSAGFLGFFGFILLFLTVVNNILYRIFLGPPVVPYQPDAPVQSSVREEPRYRIKSRSEEREEREAKMTRESTAYPQTAGSKTAPALSSEE